MELSGRTRSLWAKSDYGANEMWLPLYVHMHDACSIARKLWDTWLPAGVSSYVADEMGLAPQDAGAAVCLLAALHDVGKATPLFQVSAVRFGGMESECDLARKPRKAGLPISIGLYGRREPRHAASGQMVLEACLVEDASWPRSVARSYASIIGAHHGEPADERLVGAPADYKTALGWYDEAARSAWQSVQRELVAYARELSGARSLFEVPPPALSAPAASLVAGVVIMADWIASNQDLFPLVPLVGGAPCDERAWLSSRAADAWGRLSLLAPWEPVSVDCGNLAAGYAHRFGFPEGAELRPVQRVALEVACEAEDPGLMIIEAPMGEGKTEAAEAAAEVLCRRTGRGGVAFALPTMATTDAMFGRVHRWLNALPSGRRRGQSMYLAHGKAGLNDEFQGLVRTSRSANAFEGFAQDAEAHQAVEERAVASEWLQGRKKGMLANFVVCTVDQVLMGALQMKHLPLRQLALANKVVVIDECHAYDMYMQQYLNEVLEWLGAWRAPVILLSATLPRSLRDEFVRSYTRGRAARPCRQASAGAGLFERLRPIGERGVKADERDTRDDAFPLSVGDDGLATREERGGSESAYPLITYTEGGEVRQRCPAPSGRSIRAALSAIEDDEGALVGLLERELAGGGCAGVVCSTVGRAQRAYEALARVFGTDRVLLTHARFTDIDRMENERVLRSMLGPGGSRAAGTRPELCIVVGTQVIEQSLDIDFDMLVSDIAPIDLLLQRLGRLHRHGRPEGERPPLLREPHCYVRGIAERVSTVPQFPRDIERVYERAALLEALAVLGPLHMGHLRGVDMPSDIAHLVQQAYDGKGRCVPEQWRSAYARACEKRREAFDRKRARAQTCLLPSAARAIEGTRSLTGLFTDRVAGARSSNREEVGPRAVRDTQETIEVMLARRAGNRLHLLPWIGDERHGIARGAEVPTDFEPDAALARVLSQSTVRLPLSMCRIEQLDGLLDELERIGSAYVGAWQESCWLSGSLLLPMEERESGVLGAMLFGWDVSYTRHRGLMAIHR